MTDNIFDDLDFNVFAAESISGDKDSKSIAVHKRNGSRHLTRKAASESALENAIDWHFADGDCYHCFSLGDVDSLTYLKHILRQQPLHYVALSTWCMAKDDVDTLDEWVNKGLIGRVDFYVGEIFRASYAEVYEACKKLIKKCGGRLVVFRNHAKVMMIKGERFDCLVESSANINTNPRSENTVITVDSALVDDYIRLFSEIKPFNKDYGGEPYRV